MDQSSQANQQTTNLQYAAQENNPIGQQLSNPLDYTTQTLIQSLVQDYLKTIGSLSGGFSSSQVFTSTGTFTVPSGKTKFLVRQVGGGGSSGSIGGAGATASGGGAGAYAEKLIDLTGVTSVSVTIGAGGVAPSSGTNDGNDGGSTAFGSYMTTTGGKAGLHTGGASLGGTATGGDINITGQGGAQGYSIFASASTTTGISGYGGASFFGSGGPSVISAPTSSNPGIAAVAPGSGASGASASSGSVSSQAGAKGADGLVVIYW